MNSTNSNYNSFYSEIIELDEEKYLCTSMYGENYPEKDEALIMHQSLESLLEGQEIILQKQVLNEE